MRRARISGADPGGVPTRIVIGRFGYFPGAAHTPFASNRSGAAKMDLRCICNLSEFYAWMKKAKNITVVFLSWLSVFLLDLGFIKSRAFTGFIPLIFYLFMADLSSGGAK
jgi:hypothetical protein